MSLVIEVYKGEQGKLKIELVGRLDTNTSPHLEASLAALSPQQYPLQVLDLARLDYVSSAGLRCLFKARKELVAQQGRLLLVHLQPQVKKVFEIIKALSVDEVFASVEELDDYLDKIQRKARIGGDSD